jgi:hypothetical protein
VGRIIVGIEGGLKMPDLFIIVILGVAFLIGYIISRKAR